MATGVGLSQISFMYTVKFTDPENPLIGARIMNISPTDAKLSDFLLKFSNFRYHGNRGWSETNFDYTVKFADLENPRLVQESGTYLPQMQSYQIFC